MFLFSTIKVCHPLPPCLSLTLFSPSLSSPSSNALIFFKIISFLFLLPLSYSMLLSLPPLFKYTLYPLHSSSLIPFSSLFSHSPPLLLFYLPSPSICPLSFDPLSLCLSHSRLHFFSIFYSPILILFLFFLPFSSD